MHALWRRVLSAFPRDQRGQGTVEYFLVILAACALAIILFNWFRSGGGDNLVSDILDNVVSWIVHAF
jgi:hypothetical protein